MRIEVAEPPSREELRRAQIHELIRDFPELHPILLALGVQPRLHGGSRIAEILAGEDWIPELEDALSWRAKG